MSESWDRRLALALVALGVAALVLLYVYSKLAGVRGSSVKFTHRFSDLALVYPQAFAPPPAAAPRESRGEARCRRYLETRFRGRRFRKERPKFLRNPVTGANLELDCYNAELGLAVEYNGRQHYEFTPAFHANREAFRNQQYRDNLKRDLCARAGVTLVSVPYTVVDIEGYLEGHLNRWKPSRGRVSSGTRLRASRSDP